MDRVARDRLGWNCRRGLLELDLVLERFLRCQASTLDAAGLAALNEVLEYSDHELWAIVSGRSERYGARHAAIIARLRAT